MDELGVVTNQNHIRLPYSAPLILMEFELETAAGGISGDPFGPIRPDDNIYNPWELP